MASRWTLRPFDPESEEQAGLWRDLARMAGSCAVLMPEFVFVCARELARRPLTLAVCRSAGAPVAAAIIDRSRPTLPEVFIEDQMPLGAWVSLPEADVSELAFELTCSLGAAVRLGIPQVDARFVSRRHGGEHVSTLDYIETPWVEVEGTFEEYWASRGKNLRTNMRRQREKLAGSGVNPTTRVLTGVHEMKGAVDRYATLESLGWKARGGTALSHDHPQTAFYARMLEEFARAGRARVYQHHFDERLVATELCLHDGQELIILKTTYDQNTAPFSPASLLRQDMFESLFSDGLTRRVEFYGPLKEWHLRWTSLRREVYHLNAYRLRALRRVDECLRDLRTRNPAGFSNSDGESA